MKPTDSLFHKVRRMMQADPPFLAICLLYGRILSKAKSKCLAWLMNAPGIYLGPRSLVKGSRFIHFGQNFYAHGNLWLEAVSFYQNQCFHPSIEIGESVSLSHGVHISCIESIIIGNHVLIGSRVYISDHNHGSYRGNAQSSPDESPADRRLAGGGPVKIGDNAWIGENAVIVGPVSIGRGSIVGANSVVRSNVPDYTMVGGIPARPLKRFDVSSGLWVRT